MAKQEYTSQKFTLKNVRLVYAPGLFEKSAMNEGDEEKYSTKFMLDPKKNRRNLEDLEDLIDDLKEEGFGTVDVKGLRSCCLIDGDELENEQYHDHMVVSCSSKRRPVVVDENNEPVDAEDDLIYSGCYVDATVNVWILNHKKFGKRVCAMLRAVRFVKDGDSLSGSQIDAETEFED